MAWNVIASWLGQMVFVVAGFVMPRFMDRHIGQAALGVWDFGWSLVSYLSLAQGGIGSSVNRFVARHRAQGDQAGLNRAVASVMCVQTAATAIVLLLTCLATWLVPSLLSGQLREQVGDARWVVFLLGMSLAVQMAFDSYRGVITGCHRWDLHNGINALFYTLTVVAMICLLISGGGLRSQAMAYLIGVIATEITRAVVAYRVCPGLSVRFSHASRHQALEMLVFGSKTLAGSLSRLLLYQTNSLIIMAVLGPASLAVYSRSRSLVSHAQTSINKFGFVLTPMAGSLQAADRREELRRLLVTSSRLATYLSLPIVLVLAIMGDPLLHIWMGPRYQLGWVLAILAIGHLTEMTRQPVMGILAGLNAHGRLAIAGLAAALCSVVLGFLAVGILGWGLVGAAVSVALPLALVNGVYVPVYACRRVAMPLRRYLAEINRGPLLCAIPFAAILLLGRVYCADNAYRALLYGAGGATLILSLLYWKYVVPPRIRGAAIRGLRHTLGRRLLEQA
ncbi:MAG: oligosaccharide flippase family protein [Phycisphaerae bacterium]|nr:oligosaccharide flippase family protein [Phycisphaerae bacterium]